MGRKSARLNLRWTAGFCRVHQHKQQRNPRLRTRSGRQWKDGASETL